MQESEKWKWSCSVVSDPQRPHGLQPSRLLCPWDFPGKSTEVGCHCLLQGSISTFLLIAFLHTFHCFEKALSFELPTLLKKGVPLGRDLGAHCFKVCLSLKQNSWVQASVLGVVTRLYWLCCFRREGFGTFPWWCKDSAIPQQGAQVHTLMEN